MSGQKTAVVFGGSQGIGEATAKILKDAGDRVVIVGRDGDKLAAAAERIGGLETVVADAMDYDAISRVFEKTGVVDMVVICVPGTLKGILGPFLELNLAEVKEDFDRKTLAHFRVAQVAARHMSATGSAYGSITFVTASSARSAILGSVGSGCVNAAIEGSVLTLAAELKPIRVNAVSPGLIDTSLWEFMPSDAREAFLSTVGAKLPLGRVGQAAEVGQMIAAVARCTYATGSVYEVDGGGGRMPA